MLNSLLICNVSNNSHTCETIAYRASEGLGKELNVLAVVYIHKPLQLSRLR
jgi:hypothetical protein